MDPLSPIPPQPLLPPQPPPPREPLPFERKSASYGALISIVLILAIIVVGAFYVWGKRIAEQGQTIELPPQTIDDTGGATTTAQ